VRVDAADGALRVEIGQPAPAESAAPIG